MPVGLQTFIRSRGEGSICWLLLPDEIQTTASQLDSMMMILYFSICEHSLIVCMCGYLTHMDGPCFITEGMVYFGSQNILAEGISDKLRQTGLVSKCFHCSRQLWRWHIAWVESLQKALNRRTRLFNGWHAAHAEGNPPEIQSVDSLRQGLNRHARAFNQT